MAVTKEIVEFLEPKCPGDEIQVPTDNTYSKGAIVQVDSNGKAVDPSTSDVDSILYFVVMTSTGRNDVTKVGKISVVPLNGKTVKFRTTTAYDPNMSAGDLVSVDGTDKRLESTTWDSVNSVWSNGSPVGQVMVKDSEGIVVKFF